jgi:HAMP domain-containing protein
MKYFKYPFEIIKNIFLNSSIQRRIIILFLFLIILFSIILIEYVYFYFKKKSLEKLEMELKNLVEISYNSLVETFNQIDRNYIKFQEGMEMLKNQFNGPIEFVEIFFVLDEDLVESLIKFFKYFDLEIDKNEILITKKEINIYNIIIKHFSNKNILVEYHNNNQVKIQFPDNIAQILYENFLNMPKEIQEKLIINYQIRFIRNIDKAIIKIGKDGYIFVIQTYDPGWLLPKTNFPEDYSLEKIRERFNNKFKGYFNSENEYLNYLNEYGKTPEEQFNFIHNYFHINKKIPDPAIAIIHPYLEFMNLDNVNFEGIFPVRHIVIQRKGYYQYPWKNPTEKNIRIKIAYLKNFEYHNYNKKLHLNWVIGIGAYEDESYYFVSQIRKNLYLISILFIIIIIIIYYYFIKFNFVIYIQEIINGMKEINKGNYKVRLKVHGKDELGYIASTFNYMVRSIRKKNKELEKYAINLKIMVEEQTKQLKETILQINQIKEIQDGDYYLTSLLLHQLGQNLVHSENIKVEFFLKQIKEFEFRNKKGEIGGDICIARTIYLRENPYIFFLNADAMGKSMQGAAGSLILGSVMESILERTVQAFIFKNYSPERWLKNSFMELKHIFESFHGSMGATLVMGLIDEKTGTIYYINAEHPPGILYRNKNALFFDTDFHFQRLGVMNKQNNKEIIYIKVFPLKDNDIIIFGSDGKDDIKTKEGNIIDNEKLILNIIEVCDADLQKIYQKLNEIGELTDDLSLLKIQYNPKEKFLIDPEDKNYFLKLKKEFRIEPKKYLNELLNFYTKNPKYLPCIKLLIEYYTMQKDFKNLYEFLIKFFELKPSNTTILYLIFYSLYKQNQFQQAIDFGERYYLRNPNNINLLVQLAECYYKINNFSRSEYLIDKALNIDPTNEKIKIFIKKIKKY